MRALGSGQQGACVFGSFSRSAVCLATALALHGGLLLTAVADGPAFKPGHQPGPPGDPVQVRLQPAPGLGLPTALAAAAPRSTDSLAEAAPPRGVDAELHSEAGRPAEAAGLAGTPPSAAGEDLYVPRPWLSVPPRTLAPIVVAYPEGSAQLDHASVVLSLFIDEHGVVNRVRVDEGKQLPTSFQEAAIAAFRDARFVPGELEQQAVKAHIRVEVRFDAGPIPSR